MRIHFFTAPCFNLPDISGVMKDGMKDDVRRSFPTCHFERKREIFFAYGERVYACERKREACLSRALGATVLHSAEKGNMGNDPYTFLFIPLRE